MKEPERYIEPTYSIKEAVILRLFPLGKRTMFNLIKAGERKKKGEKIEDYIIAQNVGVPGRAAWRVTEDCLREWLERRWAMEDKTGLKKPKKPSLMI